MHADPHPVCDPDSDTPHVVVDVRCRLVEGNDASACCEAADKAVRVSR